MTLRLHFILVLVFGILLGEGKYDTVDSGSVFLSEDHLVNNSEENPKAPKGKGKTWLVSSQDWCAAVDLGTALEDLLPAQSTPF